MEALMYCNACGNVIASDDRVCSRCGKVVVVAAAPRKLVRVLAEKKIAGVCAGLALYFGLDVILLRILCVFLTLATGGCPGVITYLIAWIFVPSEPELKAAVVVQQPVAG
jgi:phage shock protein C